MVAGRGNHPCIAMWVPFSEGRGQYDTARILSMVKAQDPTRLVVKAGGPEEAAVGEVDWRGTPGRSATRPDPGHAQILGLRPGPELRIEGHARPGPTRGAPARRVSAAEATASYLDHLRDAQGSATGMFLSGVVCCPWTDVERDLTGLLTYDRAVVKLDAKAVTAANQKLLAAHP